MKDGHVKIKRIFEDGFFYDVESYGILYDSIKKEYKVKFECGVCGDSLGWYCYSVDKMNQITYEIDQGIVCPLCYDADPDEYDNDSEMCGSCCSC